ncbi:hypothetical protein LY10_01685 [Planktotalea frisia]|jgi:hypothetical protein|uniref:Uncharacterized protein n=1 Tax=Planktotalea frisia TaxID=696762 RepID=A0A1L9NYB3_9RHOB|nr:hypothetical protein [Planktotalea frisia]OJI94266.1 hypothetical protein PFRI_15020 [Planktotalea frisia]PZX29964.1 hypothetical protein LY10_01685 [Planktotalea frisia]
MIFVVALIASSVVIYPFYKLLPVFGYPSQLSFLAAFPPIALLFMWLMALKVDELGGGK